MFSLGMDLFYLSPALAFLALRVEAARPAPFHPQPDLQIRDKREEDTGF
jgi:hypothetical protein